MSHGVVCDLVTFRAAAERFATLFSHLRQLMSSASAALDPLLQRGLALMIARRSVVPRTRAPAGGDHLGLPEITSKVPGVPNPNGMRRMRGTSSLDAGLSEAVLGPNGAIRGLIIAWPLCSGHLCARCGGESCVCPRVVFTAPRSHGALTASNRGSSCAAYRWPA